MEEDDDSVGSAAFGIESSTTSFSGGALRAPPPRHVLLELDDDVDEGDLLEDSGGAATDDSDDDFAVEESDEEEDDDENRRAAHAAKTSGIKGAIPRPRGGAPRGATWDYRKGVWVAKTPAPPRVVVSYSVLPALPKANTTSSRFWGVSWYAARSKWRAGYRDGSAPSKKVEVGYYSDEEVAAFFYNEAVIAAGLEHLRVVNRVDASGRPLPKD